MFYDYLIFFISIISKIFFVSFCSVWDRVSFYMPDLPGIHYVAQTGLEFVEHSVPQPPKCWLKVWASIPSSRVLIEFWILIFFKPYLYHSLSVPLATYGKVLADTSSGETGFLRSGKSFSILVTFQKELLVTAYDFFFLPEW